MKHSPLLRDAHTTALPPRPGCTQRPESRGTVRQQQAGGRRDVQPFFLPQPMPWVMSMLTRAVKTQSLSARGAKGSVVPCGERLVGTTQRGLSQTDEPQRDREQMGHVPAWTRALPFFFLDVPGVSYL